MCTYLNDKLIAYTGQVPAHLEIGTVDTKKNKWMHRQAPNPTVNKRPGQFGPDFMTVEQAMKKLEQLARINIKVMCHFDPESAGTHHQGRRYCRRRCELLLEQGCAH